MQRYSSLLPYSATSTLVNYSDWYRQLVVMSNMVEHIATATAADELSNPSNYDAHVGDCLCQARCILWFDMHTSIKHGALDGTLKNINIKINSLLSRYASEGNYLPIKKDLQYTSKHKIKTLYKKFGIDFCFTESEYTMILMHLLSHYKNWETDIGYPRINLKNVADDLNCSINYARQLVIHWQTELSIITTEKLLQHAKRYEKTAKILRKKDKQGRVVLPSFLVGLLVTEYTKAHNINMAIKLVNTKTGEFSYIRNQHEDARNIILLTAKTISSLSTAKIALENITPEELLLISVAHHPQYIAPELAKNNNCMKLHELEGTKLVKLYSKYIEAGNRYNANFIEPRFPYVYHVNIQKKIPHESNTKLIYTDPVDPALIMDEVERSWAAQKVKSYA